MRKSWRKLFPFRFLSFLLFSIFNICAQDSSGVRKWKIAPQLDNRSSFIEHARISMLGIKFGAEYKERDEFGVGFYTLFKPAELTIYDKRNQKEVNTSIHFWYVTIFNDFIFFKDRKWEVFATVQLGYGRARIINSVESQVKKEIDPPLYITEFSISGSYKILDWVGIGIGTGYRNAVNKNNRLKSTFDAPIYVAKVILYPGVIYRKWKSKKSNSN